MQLIIPISKIYKWFIQLSIKKNPIDKVIRTEQTIFERRNTDGEQAHNNEKVEKEIKETIPFTIAMKGIKYIGVHLPKETKGLYIENYKTVVKEIKEIDGEIYSVHGSEESV